MLVTDREPPAANPPPRVLGRIWAAGLVALVGSTLALWTPLRTPPRVPPVSSLAAVPPAVDYALLGVWALGVVATVRAPRRWSIGVATVALILLMASDQLRWQPWAYQAALMGVVLAGLPAAAATRWLRVLIVSVYLWAAFAKIDIVFAGTLGQQILAVTAGWVGADETAIPASARTALALAMPLVEAAVGLLLAWPRTRRSGAALACGLHMTLVATLGPLGLGHRPGVLVWNAVSAAYTLALFWPKATWPNAAAHDISQQRLRYTRLAKVVVAAAIAGPALAPWGLWDRWPAWGLYAPRGERAELLVHDRVAQRLAREFAGSLPVAPRRGDSPWRRVRLDRWLLAECGAPRYPQNRIVAAFASGLARRVGLGGYVRVNVASAANWRTGERQWVAVEGADAIRRYADENYWLNTRPRWTR